MSVKSYLDDLAGQGLSNYDQQMFPVFTSLHFTKKSVKKNTLTGKICTSQIHRKPLEIQCKKKRMKNVVFFCCLNKNVIKETHA